MPVTLARHRLPGSAFRTPADDPGPCRVRFGSLTEMVGRILRQDSVQVVFCVGRLILKQFYVNGFYVGLTN